VTREYGAAGGLMSYGPSFLGGFRHAAQYVGKILRGAKPRRPPDRAANEIRAGDQPQDREVAGSHDPAVAAGSCPRCQQEYQPQAQCCVEWAAPVAGPAPPRVSPCRGAYAPKHPAERIIDSMRAAEGERKHSQGSHSSDRLHASSDSVQSTLPELLIAAVRS
jgi:hypothetical protein